VRRLTPTPRIVLRDAKDGHVYRSERGYDLYACYDQAQQAGGRDKKVTAVVGRLCALGLLRIGEPAGMHRLWHVTEQGAQVLAQEEIP
jgi:hypothetical protein